MARRNDGFLDLVVELPWWVGVIVAGLAYAVMRYMIPSIVSDSPFTAALGQVSYGLAPYGAGLTLLAAGVSAIRSLLEYLRGHRQHTASPRIDPPPSRGPRPVVQRPAPRASTQSGGPVERRPVTVASRPCPRCGGALVMRRASRGAHAGSSFWGCSSYPKCRHTEDVTA